MQHSVIIKVETSRTTFREPSPSLEVVSWKSQHAEGSPISEENLENETESK